MTTKLQGAVSGRSAGALAAIGYPVLGFWAIYLLLAPTTGFAWIDSWHNEQRAVQILLLSLTGLAFAGLTGFGPERIRAQLRFPWWWWVFVALGVASSVASQAPLAAFAEVGLFVLLSALTLLTAAVTAERPDRLARVARLFAVLAAVAHALAVLVRYGASVQLGKEVDLDVFMLGYANPRFASALYAALMPFVAAVVIDQREGVMLRVTAFIALSLLWTINLGLGTRGVWFAYLLALPAMAFLFGIQRSMRLNLAVVFAAVAGLTAFLAMSVIPIGNGATSSGLELPAERLLTLTSREVLWAMSSDAIVRHPVLGLGPMHFAALNSHVGAHPHNWPLQIASEWGVPALLLVMMAIWRSAVAIRNGNCGVDSVAPCLAVTAALVLGLVDGNLVLPVSQTAAALSLGLLIGSAGRSNVVGSSEVNPAPVWLGTAIVCLLANCLVVAYATSSLPEQAAEISTFRQLHPGEWLVPRFWEHGILY